MINNSIIAQSDYIISLTKNNVTDSIRNNYKNYFIIDSIDSSLKIFYVILNVIINNIESNQVTLEDGISILETEFQQLNLFTYLGEFNNYLPLINIILSNTKDTSINKVFTQYIEIANNIPNEKLKCSIYYAILSLALQYINEFSIDLNFIEELTNYVKQQPSLDDISYNFITLIKKHFYKTM